MASWGCEQAGQGEINRVCFLKMSLSGWGETEKDYGFFIGQGGKLASGLDFCIDGCFAITMCLNFHVPIDALVRRDGRSQK